MSDLTNVEEAIKNLQIGTNKGDINMILLGATGVGKSTFINALANYLTYTNFEKALSEETLILVPFVMEVEFEDGQSQKYGVGFDNRIEDLNIEDMTTQSIRKYIFPFQENERKFSIIDTPGMSGTLKDKITIENIINYISNLHTLDAICFLFNQSNTTHFKFIAEHVFPQINKFATNNVIFIFNITNNIVFDDRFAFKSLRVAIEQIGMECNIEIPLLEKNIFYFENDSLEFLVAYKNGIKNMSLKEHKARQSWRHSTKECWRLIRYIRGGEGDPPVKSYYVKTSQPICRVRRTIAQLIEPLVDVILLIHYNVDKLQNHQIKLNVQHSDINDVKKQLYVPAISFDMVKLNNPITICTACAHVVKVETINEWNFTDTCHKPCYLTNLFEGLVDDSKLKNCSAMDKSGNCLKCSCEYSKHRHLYYQTKIKHERIADSSSMVFTNFIEVRQLAEQLITDIQIRKSDLENEYNTIIMICARLSNFLQRNALSPFKDPIEAQIKYLINREKSLGESLCDKNTVEYLEKALKEYEDDKDNDITPNNILDRIQDLYKLKYMGKQIKELYEFRINMWMKEHLSTEYLITSVKAEKKEEPKNNEQQKFGSERQQNEQFDKTRTTSEKHTHPSHSAKKDYSNNNRQQKWKRNNRAKTDKRGPINDKGATVSSNSRRGNRGGWRGRNVRGGFEQRTHYEERVGKQTNSEEKVIKRDTDSEENVINVDTDYEENVSKRDSDSESDNGSSTSTIDTDEPSD